ncbi:MAG: DNA methyltransferase, partial [Phycisphaerae bacterium]|nr:DNA methyltransferase [Phycisphaerae bacterium]
MAKVENLIREIADAGLREQIAHEVAALIERKKFGLVFEEHIPELIQLPGLPVKPGARIVRRDSGDKAVFLVEEVHASGKARIRRENGEGEAETVKTRDLVVVKRFGEPIYPTLVPMARLTRAEGKPYHTIINADNFHALQLLLYCYAGQVDAIYIDPPYNSGARDWKYNNDYVDRTDQYRHSKWLAMMKRRLQLAKRLLKPDGVLVVTVDENEVGHLSVLLETEFPEYLRHMVTAVINPKGTGKLNFARVDEYIFFCVPNTGASIIKGIPTKAGVTPGPGGAALFLQSLTQQPLLNGLDDEEDDVDAEDDIDVADADDDDGSDDVSDGSLPFPPEEIGEWELRHARRRGSESSYRHQRKNQFYPIYIDEKENRVVRTGDPLPLGEKPRLARVGGLLPVWPIDREGNDRCWRFISPKMQSLIDAGRVKLGKFNAAYKSWTLNIWERRPESKKLKTVWWNKAHDAGTHGTTLLHSILGRRATFPFPKSVYAVADA